MRTRPRRWVALGWGRWSTALLLGCASGEGTTPAPPEPGACTPVAATDADLPTVPVGLDAYRAWERWPVLRIGTRTYLRSTYDRAGGNEAADASHFVRRTGDELVALDVAGPGVLAFVRTNHWHGSPWRYITDDRELVVTETSTADPDHPVAGSTFLPPSVFPPPLAVTWSETRGADLSWVPMPFERHLELRYGRSHYGTGYFIYSTFPEGATNLSHAPCTWDQAAPPDDVLALLRTTAADRAASLEGARASGVVNLPATGGAVVQRIEGPATVRSLAFDVAHADAERFGRASLRITWDDRALPSVLAPVALFFGTGSLHNRDARADLVRSFPTTVRFTGDRVRFTAIFPMPFARSALVELVSAGEAITDVAWETRVAPQPGPTNALGYLHATYHDIPVPVRGRDNVLLDTTVDEGGGEWCGTFIGTSFVFSRRAELSTLEGDPRFFFDDSATPQGQGTGTEEWGGGGDYWGGQTMTLPLVGHPVGAPSPAAATNAEDQIESAYRWLLADAMPFGKNARIQLEHGATNESVEQTSAVTFWYGLPGACLVQSDALHVGDVEDERRHAWSAVGASEPLEIEGRYDLGVDHLGDVEIYPTSRDTGRTVSTRSTFRLAVAPDNHGVLLRRKLDYAIADQRADVFVADDRDGAPFVRAGTWYLAGSTTTLFANAPTETGAVPGVLQTSNRRWRDDELLIGKALTRGRSAIRVRVDVTSAAWSEVRYAAYAWTLPPAP